MEFRRVLFRTLSSERMDARLPFAWIGKKNREIGMQRLRDKVAFITGGAGGIGSATAERFVSEGASVTVADVNGEGAQAVARRLGAKAHAVTIDLGDEPSIKRALNEAPDHFGRLDIRTDERRGGKKV